MPFDDPQSPPQPQHRDLNFPRSQAQIPNCPQTPDPHFAKTLTLETGITQIQQQLDPVEHIQAPIDLFEDNPEEPQKGSETPQQQQSDMSLTSPRLPAAVVAAGAKASTSGKRGTKRKRGHTRKLQVLQQKVQVLMGGLKVFPFVPSRNSDLAAHEKLLRSIGLWDFVHLEFDSSNLRDDLIAQLVVNYKKTSRISEVNGFRIKVSRAELARALKLPVVVPKKEGHSGVTTVVEDDGVEFAAEKSIRFIENLMLNWMILHDGDAWMMPKEVMDWINFVREGRPYKVEWATLVWYMVDKELSQGVNLVDCYYASHLQLLMKHQCEKIFLAEASEYVNVKEEEEEEEEEEEDGGDLIMVDEGAVHPSASVIGECANDEISVTVGVSEERVDEKIIVGVNEECVNEKISVGVSAECVEEKISVSASEVCSAEKFILDLEGAKTSDANDDTNMKDVRGIKETESPNGFQDLQNDCSKAEAVEPSVELTLGQDDTDAEYERADEVMDVDDSGLGDSVSWQLNENHEKGPILQQCMLGTDKVIFDVEGKVEGETNEADADIQDLDEEEEDEDDDYEEVDDEDEGEEEEEGGPDHLGKFDTLQGLSSDMFEDVAQGPFGSPLPLVNGSYMQHYASQPETSSSVYGNILNGRANHEPNISYRSTVSDGNKRLRSDVSWDHQEPHGFPRIIESMGNLLEKARVMYEAKEQQFTDMELRQQALYAELDQRERIIERERKTAEEFRQKSHAEILKLERELFTMQDLLGQYREALKASRRQFAEYRQHFPHPEEPLYKDAGPGGLVLHVKELESLRLKQEEEDRLKRMELESIIQNFEAEWYFKFEGHGNEVLKLDGKLLHAEEKVKSLKALRSSLPGNRKLEENIEQPAVFEEALPAPLPGNQKVEENIEQPAVVEEASPVLHPENLKVDENTEQLAVVEEASPSSLPGNQKMEEDIEQPAIDEGLGALSSPQPGNQKVEEIEEQTAIVED